MLKMHSSDRRRLLCPRWVLAGALIAGSCSGCGAGYPSLEVQGVVVDAETQKPLQGVGVSVRYRERLNWWQNWMYVGGWPWKPRDGWSRSTRTDVSGQFSIDAHPWTKNEEDAWPRDILFVVYNYCGYEEASQRARDDEPLFEDETLLIPGVTQRVEMRRAKPGSRYQKDACCEHRMGRAPGC